MKANKIPPDARVLGQGRYITLLDEGAWEYAVRHGRLETHAQRAVPGISRAVLDRVLQQRMNQKRRDRARLGRRIHARLDRETFLEPDLLDREIALQRVQLGRERRRVERAFDERMPEERRQLRDHLPCAPAILVDHRANGRQRVEQEVRVELVRKHLQLRLLRESPSLGRLALALL